MKQLDLILQNCLNENVSIAIRVKDCSDYEHDLQSAFKLLECPKEWDVVSLVYSPINSNENEPKENS